MRSYSCPHLAGEGMRLREPSSSEHMSSVEVISDDYATDVFKPLGHWALPVNMRDADDLTNPL